MRIALLADIHSNQYALKAVLYELKNKNIDKIIFLGDYAFGGSGTNEVVDIIMNYNTHPVIAIAGNRERYINSLLKANNNMHPVISYINKQLGDNRTNYLLSLPDKTSLTIGNISLGIRHSLPTNPFNQVNRLKREKNTPNYESLMEISNTVNRDIIVFGHYHLFMDQIVNNKRFICASSVGIPYNGDPRAQYLILTIKDKYVTIEKQYTDYNRENLVRDFEAKGYFENFCSWSMNTVISVLTAHDYTGTKRLRNK